MKDEPPIGSALLKPGQVFASRYRIVRFLAKGGMGAVFVGEHTGTEQRVAIKVLWPNILASKDAVEKFQLEAKIAGRVRSENIVQVIDAGYDAETGMPFLVMELLEGKNLEDYVAENGPLDPGVLVSWMSQVALALDRAHGYRKDGVPTPIVHRDLKPENLFLTTRDNGESLVKVLDFGIAKVVSEGTKMSRETKGTPLFMAYEQAAGGKITPQTDVWALGLIVFWLLTGKHYWKAAGDPEGTITTLFGEMLTLDLVPASVRMADVGVPARFGPGFDAWFAGCVDRDPTKRYSSASGAVSALAEALSVPFAGFADGPGSRVLRPSNAGPPPSAALPAPPSTVVARTGEPFVESTDGLASTAHPGRGRSRVPLALAGVAVVALLGSGIALATRDRGSGAAAGIAPAAPPATSVSTGAAPATAAATDTGPVVEPVVSAPPPASATASASALVVAPPGATGTPPPPSKKGGPAPPAKTKGENVYETR